MSDSNAVRESITRQWRNHDQRKGKCMTDEELGAWVRRLTCEKGSFGTLYHVTPEQYHAGIDKLWDALGPIKQEDDGTDVFTLAARAIKEGKALAERA